MSESQTGNADLNLKIVWSLARWVEDIHGRSTLEDIARAARVDVSNLDGSTHWTSLERVETFLTEVRALAGGDEPTFRLYAFTRSSDVG